MFNESDSEPSYYAVLNVSREASAEDIKRAYKSLAQVFHPDKHLDDELRDNAQEAFSKLQEAYEVLSDPQKRDVYDVYGKEGLSAGLSVGTKLKSTDDLRKEWEAFKAQQQRAREEARAHHRGIYVCRWVIGCSNVDLGSGGHVWVLGQACSGLQDQT
jgi:DnaJ family protein C protein 11